MTISRPLSVAYRLGELIPSLFVRHVNKIQVQLDEPVDSFAKKGHVLSDIKCVGARGERGGDH